MGNWITFKIKTTAGTLAETEQIQEIYSHLVSESVVELTESGAIIFEKILKNMT